MADIFDGYDIRGLDDIRTATEAVHQAIDTGARDEHAGAGTMKDAVERIHQHLVEQLGAERAVKGLAALVYGLEIDSATTARSWHHMAADRMVGLLKDQGRLEAP